MNEERGAPSHLDNLIASGHLPDPSVRTRGLIAQKVEPPPALVQQMASALTIECWRIGNTAAVLTRENVETLDQAPNYRWHLSVGHPERKPTPDELAIAMEKLPEGAAYCMEVQGTPRPESNQVDIWEIDDVPLAKRWHFDAQEASAPE